MSNKRITDLTELTNPTTDDVFPVVDIATNTTTKVQLGNLPVPNSVTTALATKQDSLVSGTNIKTINSTSVLGSGNIAVQETLVSGTNIKTLNNTSLLGSGNITLTANPSGVSGAIQFSNGSAFASDAANLFWDDTNNRLGVGTNAPTQALEIAGGSILLSNAQSLKFKNSSGTAFDVLRLFSDNSTYLDAVNDVNIRPNNGASNAIVVKSSGNIGVYELSPSARLHIKGSGSTSATTSLLVQNSAGRTALKVADNGVVTIGADDKSGEQLAFVGLYGTRLRILTNSSVDGITGSVINSAFDFLGNDLILSSKAASTTSNVYVIPTSFTSLSGSVLVNTTTDVASSVLTVNSTTKGVLFPRMTTTQKTNISSPAEGLVVYDTTLGKLCVRTASAWETITSV
jgi:hypothetical protein